MSRILVVATYNRYKLSEIDGFLDHVDRTGLRQELQLKLKGLWEFPDCPEPDETADNYIANAITKAHVAAARTGLPALGEDSGLEVDALQGAPGVHTRRFEPDGVPWPERCQRLVNRLHGVPTHLRTARFRTAAALCLPDGRHWTSEGVIEGSIHHEPVGDEGFGYDPVFWIPEHGVTMAQLSFAAKLAISHRSRALAALAPTLRQVFEAGAGLS